MAYLTNIPGLPGGPLETSFPVVIDLIPTWRHNRPGIKLRGAFETTQHNTSNWWTLARAEMNYVIGGAGGRMASWHYTADDSFVGVTLPVDEVGWHAGDGSGPGNMSTVACELTMQRAMVDTPTRWRRARRNAAEIMGKTAARKGAPPPGKYHHDYSGKNCPILLRNNATWNREYWEDYAAFYQMEREAMGATPPDPADSVIHIGDTIRTLVSLNLRQQPTTRSPVIATLAVGAEAVVNGRWESADGYGWLPVRTGLGTGAVAMGDSTGPFIEKVASAPTEPEPAYVEPRPIPALLDTDLKNDYDTATGITTDDTGHEFIFTADVIEFVVPTVAGEFAVENPRPIKAPYTIGDRAIAAWLVKNKQGVWHYVLAGGDDEWARVPYANTRRVSDAPLLGDDVA